MTKDPLKEDFRNFVWLAWQALGLPEPAPIQYDVATYIAEGPERRMVQAMRGFGKSYLTATYAAWRLYCDPDTTILCLSATGNRSREFIRLTRKLISSIEVCAHMEPREGNRDGADRFDVGNRTKVAKDPSVAAYGINSMITGTHVDLIVLDDIEIPENSGTVESREKLHVKLMEAENILNPGGEIVYLGTPQTEDSIYNKLGDHYIVRRWPARAPDPENDRSILNIAPYIADGLATGVFTPGSPTYPEYYPDDLLAEREGIMGPSIFALQMLLDTTLADVERYPLKLKNFIVRDMDGDHAPAQIAWGTQNLAKDLPSVGLGKDFFHYAAWQSDDWQDFEDSVLYIDPSGRGQDQTGFCVARLLKGTIHIPEAGGLAGGYDEMTLEKLSQLCNKYSIDTVMIEANYGDGMFSSLLAPVLGRIRGNCAIKEERVSGQKERRIIDTLEPAMATHRICIDPEVAKNKELMLQVSRITRDRGSLRHDDQVEALSGAVRYFRDRLAIDAEKKVAEELKNESLKEHKAFEDAWRTGKTDNHRSIVIGMPLPGMPRPRLRGKQKKGWGSH